jgi:hypothetical protein
MFHIIREARSPFNTYITVLRLYIYIFLSARFTLDVMLSKLEIAESYSVRDKNRFARSGYAEIRRLPLSSLPQYDIRR